ncbi:sigma 54-interacting transcriptional regulator [Psychrobacter sp. I-STPA10]|uniref:sigma 54-interacting transcriptional regulator n=1 Tax=Psychrobacter sp. I-STPA10 TaxID=2585769 RepID=UPI001E3E20D9|nr:sigma 54-interacting transcriptional regulator [Psychrobacter sp. I-STPA10]
MNHNNTLWLIDDDPALRLILEDTFNDAGLNVVVFAQAKGAWTKLNDVLHGHSSPDELPDVILTDIRMPMMDGLSFSEWVHKHFVEIPIIIMTAHSDLKSAVDSYQTGAFDYLPKPFDLDDAVTIINKAIQPKMRAKTQPSPANKKSNNDNINNDIDDNRNDKENAVTNHSNNSKDISKSKHDTKHSTTINAEPMLSNINKSHVSTSRDLTAQQAINNPSKTAQHNNRHQSHKKHADTLSNNNPSGIIGQSVAMQTVFRAIGRLANSPITVLITGESGTGKELVAGALHQHSPRRERNFIALNMAAIPHDLIESELFGHEKGAFTGATTMRQGRFEQANGGTLFLDEIGDMPFSTQTRLLRVLANGEFFRVGGQKPIQVDVRIIAATHQNLEDLVKQGKFREDLFYRLNVIRLPLPPLRERPEDIPALVEFFMQQAATEMNSSQKQLSAEAMQLMQAFGWSGNVRQLENACRWITVMATGDLVMIEDLPPELLEFARHYSQTSDSTPTLSHSTVSYASTLHTDDNAAQIKPSLDSQNTQYSDPQHSHNHAQHQPQTDHQSNTPHAHHTVNNELPFPSSSPVTASNPTTASLSTNTWQQALRAWVDNALQAGKTDILQIATPEFERILIEVALEHSNGRKGDAAELLGWGRNTLTRKIQQLEASKHATADDENINLCPN